MLVGLILAKTTFHTEPAQENTLVLLVNSNGVKFLQYASLPMTNKQKAR